MSKLAALVSGILFGIGLALSGMTNTAKVQGFLDLFGDWQPDLAFVMGGALLISLGATPFILQRSKPIFAEAFSLPASAVIDRRLIGGGVLFGIGWGLVGYCPGPAIAALAYGTESTVVFIAAMLAGMGLAKLLKLA
ncbi:YeeE/YedE family protein [Luminiphilus syltensis NOR5-1B]|uniref:YeeE/YedE family protein n=1 Tax=Luminiphilus syltensis NOR5-1B TaxID=565045 RepID=B8KXB3_9GAMM|nr:DUF6691 family protein [Luminiphilus syltensis]EED35236.1 YeeE/YedE family protein [Luminiphilus syltensis NOR5-1B]